MNWLIIALVLLSIVGSVMWMMPSPRERMQAKMRQKAMSTGLKVQMVQLKHPREIGQAEAETKGVIVYRLFRQNLSKTEKNNFNGWQIFKLNTLATDGLPEGWSWSKGEGEHQDKTPLIAEVINELPGEQVSIQSTGDSVSYFWYESGNDETVEQIKSALDKLVEAKI